ncbi:MAG: 23S rRNA (uracil(1939)-C(5))-methyltransferase RlmD [Deltaproteobacteria bacterium]|nr:23S rRNA (uracil(1939)-C(5))-methyltransferase RlmD [Deltaproteobacteria bacterium]
MHPSGERRRPVVTPRGPVATVEPLALDGGGVFVTLGARRYAIAAAVPGDRLRVLPPRRDQIPMRLRGTDTPALAARIAVVEPSPERVVAPCSVLLDCGACAIQEQRYAAQIEAKTVGLRALLAPLGGQGERIEVRGLARPFGYRSKLTMATGGTSGALRFGFYARGSFGEPVAAEGCPVQHPLTLSTLAMVRQTLDATHVAPTKGNNPRIGWLHGVMVRVDPSRGAAEITLLGRNARPPGRATFAEQLGALPGVEGVHLNVNPRRSSYALGDAFVHLAGAPRMTFTLAGHAFRLSPGSFFQTSHEGAEVLAAAVLELLPEEMRCLADLYGGVGVFSRLTVGRWERALVAEANPHAIADLRADLASGTHLPLRVIPGRVEQTIHRVLDAQPDVILLDPPRRGTQPKVLGEIGGAAPDRVVYIACGMEALVTDATRLRRAGYRIDRVIGVDMFPHTPHLEVVCSFRRA